MEEKKKKQMIVGGSAAGAVAMGAGAAILMPGQEGEGQQEELLAQNITENSTEPVEVSVTPEEPNEPDSLSESANTPIEHDLAQKANTPNKPHVASKPSEPQEAIASNTSHEAPAAQTAADAPVENSLAENTPSGDAPVDAIEPEGLSDHILAINANTEDYLPESDFDNDIQIINTPDDMQYFVVDVNNDGIYDNIYDETGMAVDAIPEGSLLADADDMDDNIFISTEDDIQVIGHEYNEDMAVVDADDQDMAVIEDMEQEQQQEEPFSDLDEQLQADVLHDLEVMQEGLDHIDTELSAVVDEFADAVDEALDGFADLLGMNEAETDVDDSSSFTSDMDDMGDLSDIAMQ